LDWRRPFNLALILSGLALIGTGIGNLSGSAFAAPGDPTPLSRVYLISKGRMDAAGRIIQPGIGTAVPFWVRVPNDTFGRIYKYVQRAATLQRTGAHCFLFVEWGTQVPDSVLDDLKATYDSIVYPTCRRYFGQEWNPGIDGDSLITILLSPSLHMEFYFSPFDEMADSLAQTKGHRSNEREMFYLRPGGNLDRMKAAMAHCEEHLIHWWQNPPGEAWLDEACAMYAMDLCGYGNTISEIYAFQRNPGLNIAEWPSKIVDLPGTPYEPMSARRGEQYAFLAYLADNFPGRNPNDPMIYHLVARRDLGDSTVFKPYGYMNVAVALWETGGPPSFLDPYQRWTVANFVNDTTLADSNPPPGMPRKPFGYRKPLGGDPQFRVLPTVEFKTFPDSARIELGWYQQAYVQVSAGLPSLRVEIVQDTAFWWMEGVRYRGYVYWGYIITSTSAEFAPGTNTIVQHWTPPYSFQTIVLNLDSQTKAVRIMASLPQAYPGSPPMLSVFAYTPFNPKDTTVSRSAYVFPNPFNPEREKVHFRYVVADSGKVDIRVYDAAGNQVAVVADNQATTPGIYNSQTWDGRNYRGTPVANGVYFGRMRIGKQTTGVKIAVMR